MSAQRWFIPGPNGQRKETTDFTEVQAFLKEKKQERENLLVGRKTPTPPKFVHRAHNTPNMRMSLR